MKSQLAKPFFFLIGFILIVSLACSLGGGAEEPAPAPVEEEPVLVEEEPTPAEPEPTVPPPPPEPVAPQFYTEEFDGDTSQWTYFLVDGNKNVPVYVEEDFGTMFVGTDEGRLHFDLESKGQWAYVTYDAHEYENVRLDAVVENRGVNNNNVSLICRYTPDEGWYEFNIANNGLYWIFHAIIQDDDSVIYTQLADGGSNKIKPGKEINKYTIVCNNRDLRLYINDNETRVLEENRYALRDGLIGVSVSSFGTLPVKVEVDSVTISEP